MDPTQAWVVQLMLFAFVLCCLKPSPCSGFINVALNKPTKQSMTYLNADSSRATDGNTNGNFSYGQSCSHTGTGNNVWWIVDLLATYPLRLMRIYNRNDDKGDYLTNYYVHVSIKNPLHDSSFPSIEGGGTLCINNTYLADRYQPANIACEQIIYGRYVYIWKAEHWLSLCEVEVFVDVGAFEYIQRSFDVLKGRRIDITPFLTPGLCTSDIQCITACLASIPTTATVVQFDVVTGRCECIQYSNLTSTSWNVLEDNEWNMCILSNN